ncbi:ribonuclease H-like domain-containing protein [Tanacetum coccineum]
MTVHNPESTAPKNGSGSGSYHSATTITTKNTMINYKSFGGNYNSGMYTSGNGVHSFVPPGSYITRQQQPSAFSTMPLEDPTWNMDTGDGKIILVTNTGHSILPTLSRPFSGDLYPLTKPSHVPSALLSVSYATWHQRLGHPGAEVLQDPISDPTLYRTLAGGLQYLTFTRPYISYAAQQVCLHMHDPREAHLATLKRVLRYVRGTLDFGLQLYASITGSLVAYTDADWAGCPTTRRSTSGYYIFLGDNLLSWSAKRQHTLSRSSAEAEYRGVANVVAETAWLRNLLRQTKHIEIDIHFVRDIVARGQVRVLHVPSRYQYADIFTKGLPSALFEEFRTSLSVRPSPAQTAGEC